MGQIIRSVRQGTGSRLGADVGLLRVLLIKQILRNWLICTTSAEQRSHALSDVEQQNSPYQMVLIRWSIWESAAEGIKFFCHVPLWTFRKKVKWLQKASTFCALLIRDFWQYIGLVSIRKCQLLKPKSFSGTVQFSVKFCLRKTSMLILAYLMKSILFRNSFFVFFQGYIERSAKLLCFCFLYLFYECL